MDNVVAMPASKLVRTPEPRVLNQKFPIPPASYYVGPGSRWAGPFDGGTDIDRAEMLATYKEWLLSQPELVRDLPTLKGLNLICWCAPLPCHADVLLALANPTLRCDPVQEPVHD